MRPSITRLYTALSPYRSYAILHPSTALTVYPDIRPVPRRIPRPAYVPANFFDAGWGDHEEVEELPVPSQEEGRLDKAGVDGVRRAGKLAAEILREAGKLIKVCSTLYGYAAAESSLG